MKNIFTVIILGTIAFINAQGITMTLGGNTANDKFVVENSDSEAGLVVTGEGKVGIGNDNPSANLHVNGEDGILFTGVYDNGTIPFEGAGTRMMWYTKKAAFRAGYVSGNEWDDVNVGAYSIALGVNSIASGWGASTALGWHTTASGDWSTAMGSSPIASGNLSTAMELQTIAESSNSFAIGRCNVGGGNPGVWVDTDPLFEIGIGNPANPNNIIKDNAMTVLKNGNVGIGVENPNASLEVNGDIILGESGTRFMEILEITGITGSGTFTAYTDKLPSGWTGAKTRVLSFELQNNNTSGAWYSAGFSATPGGDEIAYHLIHFNRDMTVYYPDQTWFHGRDWRAMIMRMP